jgi:hypothetical protein
MTSLLLRATNKRGYESVLVTVGEKLGVRMAAI